MEENKKLVDTIVKGIQEKKGMDIVVVDLSKIDGAICRCFIVCTGQSPTQVQAIADSVSETVRMEAGEKPVKARKTQCGWQWTTPTSWCMSSCPTRESIMISSTYGRMRRKTLFLMKSGLRIKN